MARSASFRPGSPSRFLLLLPLLLGLALVAPLAPAWAEGEEEVEPGLPIDRDTEASRLHFADGMLAREEMRRGEAANAYWKAVDTDLLNYRAHVHYQEMALAAGDPVEAMQRDYDKFIEEHPDRLGFKLHRLRLNEPEPRLAALEKLAKSNAKRSDVHLEIGRALLALGRAKDAVPPLKKALALKTGARPDVLIMLAEAEHASGKSEDAIKRLDEAVKAQAEFFEGRLVLARLLLLTKQYEPSAQHADVVLKQRPSYLAAFLIKAEALAATQKDEEAREVLKAAYRVNNELNDVVLAYADLWARFEDEASYKQALQLYGEVRTRDEENWRASYGEGWVLERMAKYEEAEEKYRAVAALQPLSAQAINSIGYVLYKQGRVSEAQVQFKRATDLDPEFVSALANLGACFDAQAKYGEAIKIYEKILKMKGQEKNLRAIINCAFDYEAVASFGKAMKLLLQAHELLPKDANIVVWIGDNAYFQEKWNDAEKWYQEAIALDEENFFAWRGLGLTLAQRKRWADAAQALERASKIKPDDTDLLVTLGDLYWLQLKDLEAALAKYEAYVQKGGTDPEVRDAIIEIRKQLEK